MNQKYFKKHIEKLVSPNQYFIIDGENYGITDNRDSDAISTKYSNSHCLGGFCPERRLYKLLKAKKAKENYNKKRFKAELEEFFESKDFIGAVCAASKAQATYGVDEDINIFVVLPNLVYKMMADAYVNAFHVIPKIKDFKFAFTQEDIESKGRKILKKPLSKKRLKEVLKGIKKAEKKYKLKYDFDEDDD